MDELSRKHEALKGILESYGSLLVAFSGGVDSALLLAVAREALGDRVLAVTVRSETYPGKELESAREIAKGLGVIHRVIYSRELSMERFVSNPPDRCYWCKRELLSELKAVAAKEGMAAIAVASHLDDRDDYRPGERAVEEMGVARPLREARFTKDDIRRLSKRLGLRGWRREAMACLASRFPYGERITPPALERVEMAEALLRRKGFRSVRVRCAGKTARIEVDSSQLGRFARRELRREVVTGLKRLGFLYVSLDLEGYRTGSLNRELERG